MPDITLFEADLSGSKFVAPFGHYHEGEEYESTEDEGGRNWKLLAGLAVVVAGAVGGAAFFLKRKFGGDDTDADEDGVDEFEAEGRFGFDEEFDVEADADDEFDRERKRPAADESESRKGAVAAVVGLLFLLVVTALVKRRGGDDATAVEVDVEEPDRTTTAERER